MRTAWREWLVVGVLLATTAYVVAEEISLTTYYPSPKGAYQTLSSTSSSSFAIYEGGVGIGARSAAGGKFAVAGSPAVNPSGGTCPAGTDWYDENGDGSRDAGECKPTALYAALDGKVGIGTTNPGFKLDAQGGDVNASGKLRENGNALIPAGAIMFFNLASCPDGWTEFTQAQGRYPVGLPLSGTLRGIAGTALTDLENRAVGQHTHLITDPGHVHTMHNIQAGPNVNGSGVMTKGADYSIDLDLPMYPAGTGITINAAGTVAGTNAPYIQLLSCSKD